MPLTGNKKDDKPSVNYKARLEKKLHLAQESPEPVFDLSVCDLKQIPSNVFALCRVLRKEALYLQNNNLTSLSSGGSLADLKGIKVLDISSNKFRKLPDNISELESLQILDVSNNQLSELPETIGNLRNLVSLNLAYNNIQHLPYSLGNCQKMEVLNLTFNENLKQLPPTLTRMQSLVQLKIDSTVNYPPNDICSQGVIEILKFLKRELREDVEIPSTSAKVPAKSIPSFDSLKEKIDLYEKSKQEKQNERLLLEKQRIDKNQNELKIQQKLKDDKKKLLDDVKNRQNSLDAKLLKLQEKRNIDRALLIRLCQDEEKKSSEVVCKILSVKRNLQLQYSKDWEKARKTEEEMLFSCSAASRAVERRQILASMEELMTEEIIRTQKIKAERNSFVMRSVASEISQQNECLAKFIKQRCRDSNNLLESLRRNEELQESAVASLLEKSDERWWELTQKIRIVEVQLAELTRLELAKRKLESEFQITELSKNRIALAELLMNLLEQQTQRREQLVEAMRKMEYLKASVKESEMFWMQQYDKLLNSKGHEMVKFLEALNPKLVYELYINGVFQYLPLLKDICLSEEEMRNARNEDLVKCGVSNAEDRNKILRIINSFLDYLDLNEIVHNEPTLEEPSAPLAQTSDFEGTKPSSYIVPDECVICMETKPSVIFVPCGHLCCCYKCSKSVTLCPLCRRLIDGTHDIVN